MIELKINSSGEQTVPSFYSAASPDDERWQIIQLDKNPTEIALSTDLQRASILSPSSLETSKDQATVEMWEVLCKEIFLNHEFAQIIQVYKQTDPSNSFRFLKQLEETFNGYLQTFLDDLFALEMLEAAAGLQLKAFPEIERSILKAIVPIFIQEDQSEDVERIEQKILLLDKKIGKSTRDTKIGKSTRDVRQWKALCKKIILDYKFSPLIDAYDKAVSFDTSRAFLDSLEKYFTKGLKELLDSLSDLAWLEEEVTKNLEAFPALERAILKAMIPILIEEEESESVERIQQRILLLSKEIAQKETKKSITQLPALVSEPPLPSLSTPTTELCNEILEGNFSTAIATYEKKLSASSGPFLARIEVALANAIAGMNHLDIQILEEEITNKLDKYPELQRAILKGIASGFIYTKEKIRIAEKILDFDKKIAQKIQARGCEKFHHVDPVNEKIIETNQNIASAISKQLWSIFARKETATFAIATTAALGNLPINLSNAMVIGGITTIVLPSVPLIGRFFKTT